MTTTATQQPSPDTKYRTQQLLIGILAAALPPDVAAAYLTQTLTAAGIPLAAAQAAVNLAGTDVLGGSIYTAGELSAAAGVATVTTAQQEITYQAAYLWASAERLEQALEQTSTQAGWSDAMVDAVQTERRYRALHQAAVEHRKAAAAQVDRTAAQYGMTLGWYLGPVKTAHTPVCEAAAGHNFQADRRPLPGWPGTTHAMCACHAGAPHRLTMRSVDDVTRPMLAAGKD